jgi:hypothetical protein
VSEQKDGDQVAGDSVVDGARVDGAVVDGRVDGAVSDDAVVSDAGTDGAVSNDAIEGDAVAAGEAAPSKQLRLRRAPRYGSFGFSGVLVGIVSGLVLALSFPAASNYSTQTIAGYFAAIFGLIGAVLGLGVAVLIERRRS